MPRPDPTAVALTKAAFTLHSRALWRSVPPDAPFLLRLPAEPFPLVASIMGHNGTDFGLSVLRGEAAFEVSLRIRESDADPDTVLSGATLLGVSVEPLGAIDPALRGLVAAAGLQMRRESLAPCALSSTGGRDTRSANRGEMKLLLACVRAVLAADDASAFRPLALDRRRRRLTELTVEAPTPLIPDTRVSVREVGWPKQRRAPRAAGQQAPAGRTPPAGPQPAPMVHTPFTVLTGGPTSHAKSRLADARLQRTPVPGTPIPSTPLPDAPVGDAPLPDTLAAWKAADDVLTNRLLRHFDSGRPPFGRLMTRYFGSEALGRRVLSECRQLEPEAGFLEWALVDWRPSAGSPTYIERVLAAPATSPTDRLLGRARAEAALSVYRVDTTRPGDGLDVEDVLSGERLTVHDRLLSACDIRDTFLTLRLHRVERWNFCTVTAPPLTSGNVTRAFARLEEAGADLAPGGLRRAPYLVGRLWEFALPDLHPPPRLSNTDGDPLQLQVATFSVIDAAALARGLAARRDVEEAAAGEWVWLREGGPAPGFGTTTILAHLQLLGDSLVVDVNSDCRLARARKWLDRLPGVRFVSVTHRSPEQEVPVDDRLPAPPAEPPSPELLAEMKRMHDEALRGWLDTKVPALGNRTPRQASRSAAGRRQVERLIRSMPPMLVNGGASFPAPREMLLRELGLSGEGAGG